jgi:hypothetical protein
MLLPSTDPVGGRNRQAYVPVQVGPESDPKEIGRGPQEAVEKLSQVGGRVGGNLCASVVLNLLR